MRPFRAVALLAVAVAFWGGMRAEAILGEVARRFEPMLTAPPSPPRVGDLAPGDPSSPVYDSVPAAPTPPSDMMVYTYPTPGADAGGTPARPARWRAHGGWPVRVTRNAGLIRQDDPAPPLITRTSAPASPTHVPAPLAENRPDMSEQAYQSATRAYASLRVGDRRAAASAFAVALSLDPTHPRASAWRREQKRLSRWWRADVYLFQRAEGAGRTVIRTPGLPAASPVLGGGMAAGLLAVTPNPLGRRPVEVFVRYAIPQNGFRKADRVRAQGAAGVSIRPFPRVPVTLVAERLFRLGSLGRDDWALRGYGGTSKRVRGIDVSLFGEAGVIGTRPDTFAGAQLIAEKSFKLPGKLDAGLGVGAWGAVQHSDRTIDRLDIGPTLRLSHPRAPISVRVEYRARVTGNARPGSGVALTVSSAY